MRAKCLIGLGLLAMLAASCALDAPSASEQGLYPSITAGFDNGATKVSVDEAGDVVWNEGDKIALFYHNVGALCYVLEEGAGSTSGTFGYSNGADGGSTIPYICGFYPYAREVKLSTDGEFSFQWPAVQAYAEDSFAPGSNPMVAVSQEPSLYFRNLGGYLVLPLWGEASVKSITLCGAAGEPLAGPAVAYASPYEAPYVSMGDDAVGEVVLTCKEPVTVGETEDEATEFWFVLPPTYFEEGFVITVAFADGTTFEVQACDQSEEYEIKRNTVFRMGSLEVTPPAEDPDGLVDLGLSVKWASCNLGAETPEDYGDYFAWGETEPKDYYDYEFLNYKFYDAESGAMTKYNRNDGLTVLELEDDAAYQRLGKDLEPGPNGEILRMPTMDEFLELLKTSAAFREYYGVTDYTGPTFDWEKVWEANAATGGTSFKGWKVTSTVEGFEGNSIFFPTPGWYGDEDDLLVLNGYGYFWSSSVDPSYVYDAYFVMFDGSSSSMDYVPDSRYWGLSIRPVYGPYRPESDILFQEGFEGYSNGSQPTGWTFIDADEDGFGWYTLSDEESENNFTHSSGDGHLTSASYQGVALSPDNWAITPPIKLASADNYLSFWVAGQDPSWAKEHYAVYVTTVDPEEAEAGDYTCLFEETFGDEEPDEIMTAISGGSVHRFILQIPEGFDGETVYIAFRHYNCYDMFRLNLDDVMVTVGVPTIPYPTNPSPAPALRHARASANPAGPAAPGYKPARRASVPVPLDPDKVMSRKIVK